MENSPRNLPDGGWGWIIVGAVALINMTNQSIPSVFGLLFGHQLESMNEGTSTAALITNLNSLTLNFCGLFVSPAIKKLAPRKVAIIGCLFVSMGLALSSIATKVWELIACYSFCIGIGLGLIAPSTFLIINSYFSKKRSRAVGIGLAGAGLGQMVIPHIVRIFLDYYGYRSAVRALAVFSLVGLAGAALFRPLKSSRQTARKHNNHKNIKLLLENRDFDVKKNHIRIKIEPCEGVKVNHNSSNRLCVRLCGRLIEALDLELLKDLSFWSIILGIGLVYTTTQSFSMLYPYFLQSKGLSRSDSATCMSIIAGADIIFRLIFSLINPKYPRIVFLLGSTGLFISRAALAESMSTTSIIAMSIFTGMAKSATVLNNNLVISEHCRPEKLAGGVGLNMISKGIFVITVGQILGWIRDHTNSYVLCIHAQNIVLLLVIVVWSLELIFKFFITKPSDQKLKAISEYKNGTEDECTQMKSEGKLPA